MIGYFFNFDYINILSVPIDWFKSVFCQICVAFAEMLASKEAIVCREW